MTTTFSKHDTGLIRTVLLFSGLVFISAVLENLTSHWKYFKYAFISETQEVPAKKYSSVWEDYYVNSHPQHASIIPYNIVLAIGVCLCNKWAVYAWNFGDVLISVIARAIYKRFQLNYKDFKEKLKTVPAVIPSNVIN